MDLLHGVLLVAAGIWPVASLLLVKKEVETLRRQVTSLKTRFETGGEHNEVAMSIGYEQNDGEAVLCQLRTAALPHLERIHVTVSNVRVQDDS
jgi:hypothetical protein